MDPIVKLNAKKMVRYLRQNDPMFRTRNIHDAANVIERLLAEADRDSVSVAVGNHLLEAEWIRRTKPAGGLLNRLRHWLAARSICRRVVLTETGAMWP